MKPEYTTVKENGQTTVRATAFGQVIATSQMPGVGILAEKAARRACENRVKYLFSQAKA